MSGVRPGLARAATRLVVAGLLTLALLPPLLWAAAGWVLAQRTVEDDLIRIGWLMARAGEDPTQRAAALAQPPFDPGRDRRELRDAEGRVLTLVEEGRAPARPSLRRERWLPVDAPDQVATVLVVTRSLSGLVANTLMVALGSGAFALALWGWAFRRPVRDLGQAEGRVLAAAHRDPLTGLLNRDGFQQQVARAWNVRGGRDSRRTLGLLILDIDRFGLVNDSLGQPAGDDLLQQVARRLRTAVREGDRLARIGGDQFAILVEGITGPPALAAMARNLMRGFESPCEVEGRQTLVTLSIGMVTAHAAVADVDGLFRRADLAMRMAKQGGGGRFRLHEESMNVDTLERLDMDVRLHRALAGDEFILMYQPVMAADGHTVLGVEALARWSDPERGLVPPSDFIPVLEQTGMIVPVGRRLLGQACRTAAGWLRAGARPFTLAVNVSPREFAEQDFVEATLDIVAASGLPAQALVLEVTEGLLLDESTRPAAKIEALAAAGIQLAVDDFGIGYSSLAYLKQFRLHVIKIDRMLVRDIAVQPKDRAIVQTIMTLSRTLGLRVVAEGIETEGQKQRLMQLGCHLGQGYLLGRPGPAPV